MKDFSLVILIVFFVVVQSNGQKPQLIEKPFKAVINNISTEWVIYADSEMKKVPEKIFPFDTVVVLGWSTWSFYIKYKTSKGYISYQALDSSHEVDEVLTWIKLNSIQSNSIQVIGKADTIPFLPLAELHLTTSKDQLYVGECFGITLNLFIYDENKVPMQFHQLGEQYPIIANSLHPKECWSADKIKTDVFGIPNQKLNNQIATRYEIATVTLCPSKVQDIEFPVIDLAMKKMDVKRNFHKLIHFYSEPLKIKIKPIPVSGPSKFDHYQMVGDFKMTDSFEKNVSKKNFPVSYKLKIEGEGHTCAISAPKIEIPNALIELDNVVENDSITAQKYVSSKTFYYTFYFQKAGDYDLSNKISFTYFDPQTQNTSTIYSRGRVSITDSNFSSPKLSSPFYSTESLILIDGSQSMLIEDYKPNRLKAITRGLSNSLSHRTKCDIGLIEFAGYPKFIDVSYRDSCYHSGKLESIWYMMSERGRGTAIGEAILFVVNYAKPSLKERRIVVIGDGDNTAGHIGPEMAAQIAKEHHIKIFSIGVGTKGLAPYGVDQSGRPQMVENTFQDTTLKNIASATGGEYFWAKDSDDLAKILKRIFPN